MQIVIDIPEMTLHTIEKYKAYPYELADVIVGFDGIHYTIDEICEAILNGTPLPEYHGRLIDADALMKLYGFEDATKYGNETAEQQTHSYNTMMMYEIADMLDDAPTIIEAEGSES